MHPRLARPSFLVPLTVASALAGAPAGDEEGFPPVPVTDADRANHERMLETIEAVREQAEINHPFIGRQRLERLEEELEATDPEANLVRAIELCVDVGILRVKLGEDEGGIASLQRALELMAGLPESARLDAEPVIRYALGTAYMRLGEVRNCVARHSSESCLLPIRGAGVHEDRFGSEHAIENLERVLDATSEGHALRYACRWLLNVLAMTLGEYPDGVREDVLVPPEVFTSAVEFPRFPDIAPRLGLSTMNLAGGVVTEDFDRDGDFDVLTSTWDPTGQIHYFRNEGDGSFADVTREAGLLGILAGSTWCRGTTTTTATSTCSSCAAPGWGGAASS